jgi:hypothetical protein
VHNNVVTQESFFETHKYENNSEAPKTAGLGSNTTYTQFLRFSFFVPNKTPQKEGSKKNPPPPKKINNKPTKIE